MASSPESNCGDDSKKTALDAEDAAWRDASNACDKSQSTEERPADSEDVGDTEEEEEDVCIIDEEELGELEKTMTEEERMSKKERASKLKAEGNASFKSGHYADAMESYTEALKTCPLSLSTERSILYSNRGATWSRLGKNKLAIQDCTKAIELNPSYLKPILKRAQLNKEMKNLDEALKDYQRVLELDPSVGEARHACMTLPDEIRERNEKLQAEMIGKLKELGNLVLKPFGMSTDNFKLIKDGEGGGYKIEIQK